MIQAAPVADQIHAHVMRVTATYYDQIRHFKHSQIDSSCPGVWLTYACAEARPGTEDYESLQAILSSYRVTSRETVLKYPGAEGPRDRDGEEVFLRVSALENRSLSFSEENNLATMDNLVIFCEKADSARRLPLDRNRSIKEKRQRSIGEPKEAKLSAITAARLNLDYEKYQLGGSTLMEMEQSLERFIAGRMSRADENKLRNRGVLDTTLNDFLLSMHRALDDKRFRGENDSEFSVYVLASWKKRRISAFKALDRQDERYQSAAFSNGTMHDSEEHRDRPDIQLADRCAYQRSKLDVNRLKDSLIAAEKARAHRAGLKGPELEMFDDLLAGVTQEETAARLSVSRDAVGRFQRSTKRKIAASVQVLRVAA